MESLRALGGEDWFQLGDLDLALHVERTRRLKAGETLSAVTAFFAARLGVAARIAPMSDDSVRTILRTSAGELAFQHYFVRARCAPRVDAIRFDGAATARMSPAFRNALARNDLGAIIVCPSNPYLSVDPILAVPGVREALNASAAPRIAICPIIGGESVKGPTAKLMQELGVSVEPASIAAHYRGLIDALVIDRTDAANAADVEREGATCVAAATLMRREDDKIALAHTVLEVARGLRARDVAA
jgi:LPPG:FO 2-phospho-L-lactate transferase